MKTPWGDIGEAAARKIVRENLWPWQDGGACTPEDLLHMSWFGMQPWLVELEGETLKAMMKLAALEEWQIFQFSKSWVRTAFSPKWKYSGCGKRGGGTGLSR